MIELKVIENDLLKYSPPSGGVTGGMSRVQDAPPPLEDPEQFSFLRQGTKPGLQRSQAPLAATAQWKASRMDGGLSQHGRGSA